CRQIPHCHQYLTEAGKVAWFILLALGRERVLIRSGAAFGRPLLVNPLKPPNSISCLRSSHRAEIDFCIFCICTKKPSLVGFSLALRLVGRRLNPRAPVVQDGE